MAYHMQCEAKNSVMWGDAYTVTQKVQDTNIFLIEV